MQTIKEYAEQRKEALKAEIAAIEKKPTLVIIQLGDNPASNSYVRGKLKDCDEVGIPCTHHKLSYQTTEDELLQLIEELNTDDTVSGFIVQLPLPEHISETKVIEAIKPEKDVDGFSKKHLVDPATPTGIIDYLEAQNFTFRDKKAVVIGRSNIVGRPIARMLLDRDCNVTVIHSKTSAYNKMAALDGADLIVVATGHRNTLTDDDIKTTCKNCFIVDVGLNRNDEGKLCGDCEAVTIREKTPVPGGCGLTTRLALISNLLKLVK